MWDEYGFRETIWKATAVNNEKNEGDEMGHIWKHIQKSASSERRRVAMYDIKVCSQI